jgi:hypothetical protein
LIELIDEATKVMPVAWGFQLTTNIAFERFQPTRYFADVFNGRLFGAATAKYSALKMATMSAAKHQTEQSPTTGLERITFHLIDLLRNFPSVCASRARRPSTPPFLAAARSLAAGIFVPAGTPN